MTDIFVKEAKTWADFLVRAEFRGPGDTLDAAMSRCERKHKISHSVLWSLRYRAPKDLFVSVYMTLRDAYHEELSKLDQRLEHEIRKAETLGLNEDNSKAYRMARSAMDQSETRV